MVEDGVFPARKLEILMFGDYRKRMKVRIFTGLEPTLESIASLKQIERKSLKNSQSCLELNLKSHFTKPRPTHPTRIWIAGSNLEFDLNLKCGTFSPAWKVKHLRFSTGSRKRFNHGSLEDIETFCSDNVFFAISSLRLLAFLGSLLSVWLSV